MSSLTRSDSRISASANPMERARAVIEDYLDCLTAPLVGIVPYESRIRLRNEAAFHLESLQEEFLEQGMSTDESAHRAIAEYGGSRQISDEFLLSWFNKLEPRPIYRRFGRGPVIAFAIFSLLHLACTFVLQYRVFRPSGSARDFAILPAQFNENVGGVLPIPEQNPLYFGLLGALLLAPLAGGIAVGMQVPVRAGMATYRAQVPCVLFSFVSGVILLPAKEMLLFGLLQTLYWIPAGTLTASVTSIWMRYRRCGWRGLR